MKKIETVIEHYFQGTHLGDAEKLRQAFHPQAHITGNFSGSRLILA
jgi:hypothetical protein